MSILFWFSFKIIDLWARFWTGVLQALPDNHPKTVLSMDPPGPDKRDGIRWRNVIDFLVGG